MAKKKLHEEFNELVARRRYKEAAELAQSSEFRVLHTATQPISLGWLKYLPFLSGFSALFGVKKAFKYSETIGVSFEDVMFIAMDVAGEEHSVTEAFAVLNEWEALAQRYADLHRDFGFSSLSALSEARERKPPADALLHRLIELEVTGKVNNGLTELEHEEFQAKFLEFRKLVKPHLQFCEQESFLDEVNDVIPNTNEYRTFINRRLMDLDSAIRRKIAARQDLQKVIKARAKEIGLALPSWSSGRSGTKKSVQDLTAATQKLLDTETESIEALKLAMERKLLEGTRKSVKWVHTLANRAENFSEKEIADKRKQLFDEVVDLNQRVNATRRAVFEYNNPTLEKFTPDWLFENVKIDALEKAFPLDSDPNASSTGLLAIESGNQNDDFDLASAFKSRGPNLGERFLMWMEIWDEALKSRYISPVATYPQSFKEDGTPAPMKKRPLLVRTFGPFWNLGVAIARALLWVVKTIGMFFIHTFWFFQAIVGAVRLLRAKIRDVINAKNTFFLKLVSRQSPPEFLKKLNKMELLKDDIASGFLPALTFPNDECRRDAMAALKTVFEAGMLASRESAIDNTLDALSNASSIPRTVEETAEIREIGSIPPRPKFEAETAMRETQQAQNQEQDEEEEEELQQQQQQEAALDTVDKNNQTTLSTESDSPREIRIRSVPLSVKKGNHQKTIVQKENPKLSVVAQAPIHTAQAFVSAYDAKKKTYRYMISESALKLPWIGVSGVEGMEQFAEKTIRALEILEKQGNTFFELTFRDGERPPVLIRLKSASENIEIHVGALFGVDRESLPKFSVTPTTVSEFMNGDHLSKAAAHGDAAHKLTHRAKNVLMFLAESASNGTRSLEKVGSECVNSVPQAKLAYLNGPESAMALAIEKYLGFPSPLRDNPSVHPIRFHREGATVDAGVRRVTTSDGFSSEVVDWAQAYRFWPVSGVSENLSDVDLLERGSNAHEVMDFLGHPEVWVVPTQCYVANPVIAEVLADRYNFAEIDFDFLGLRPIGWRKGYAAKRCVPREENYRVNTDTDIPRALRTRSALYFEGLEQLPKMDTAYQEIEARLKYLEKEFSFRVQDDYPDGVKDSLKALHDELRARMNENDAAVTQLEVGIVRLFERLLHEQIENTGVPKYLPTMMRSPEHGKSSDDYRAFTQVLDGFTEILQSTKDPEFLKALITFYLQNGSKHDPTLWWEPNPKAPRCNLRQLSKTVKELEWLATLTAEERSWFIAYSERSITHHLSGKDDEGFYVERTDFLAPSYDQFRRVIKNIRNVKGQLPVYTPIYDTRITDKLDGMTLARWQSFDHVFNQLTVKQARFFVRNIHWIPDLGTGSPYARHIREELANPAGIRVLFHPSQVYAEGKLGNAFSHISEISPENGAAYMAANLWQSSENSAGERIDYFETSSDPKKAVKQFIEHARDVIANADFRNTLVGLLQPQRVHHLNYVLQELSDEQESQSKQPDPSRRERKLQEVNAHYQQLEEQFKDLSYNDVADAHRTTLLSRLDALDPESNTPLNGIVEFLALLDIKDMNNGRDGSFVFEKPIFGRRTNFEDWRADKHERIEEPGWWYKDDADRVCEALEVTVSGPIFKELKRLCAILGAPQNLSREQLRNEVFEKERMIFMRMLGHTYQYLAKSEDAHNLEKIEWFLAEFDKQFNARWEKAINKEMTDEAFYAAIHHVVGDLRADLGTRFGRDTATQKAIELPKSGFKSVLLDFYGKFDALEENADYFTRRRRKALAKDVIFNCLAYSKEQVAYAQKVLQADYGLSGESIEGEDPKTIRPLSSTLFDLSQLHTEILKLESALEIGGLKELDKFIDPVKVSELDRLRSERDALERKLFKPTLAHNSEALKLENYYDQIAKWANQYDTPGRQNENGRCLIHLATGSLDKDAILEESAQLSRLYAEAGTDEEQQREIINRMIALTIVVRKRAYADAQDRPIVLRQSQVIALMDALYLGEGRKTCLEMKTGEGKTMLLAHLSMIRAMMKPNAMSIIETHTQDGAREDGTSLAKFAGFFGVTTRNDGKYHDLPKKEEKEGEEKGRNIQVAYVDSVSAAIHYVQAKLFHEGPLWNPETNAMRECEWLNIDEFDNAVEDVYASSIGVIPSQYRLDGAPVWRRFYRVMVAAAEGARKNKKADFGKTEILQIANLREDNDANREFKALIDREDRPDGLLKIWCEKAMAAANLERGKDYDLPLYDPNRGLHTNVLNELHRILRDIRMPNGQDDASRKPITHAEIRKRIDVLASQKPNLHRAVLKRYNVFCGEQPEIVASWLDDKLDDDLLCDASRWKLMLPKAEQAEIAAKIKDGIPREVEIMSWQSTGEGQEKSVWSLLMHQFVAMRELLEINPNFNVLGEQSPPVVIPEARNPRAAAAVVEPCRTAKTLTAVTGTLGDKEDAALQDEAIRDPQKPEEAIRRIRVPRARGHRRQDIAPLLLDKDEDYYSKIAEACFAARGEATTRPAEVRWDPHLQQAKVKRQVAKQEDGHSLMVQCALVRDVEHLSKFLSKLKIPHYRYDGTRDDPHQEHCEFLGPYDSKRAMKLSEAPGAIILTTNFAGRAKDWSQMDKVMVVRPLGGFRPFEQGVGRTARQGESGASERILRGKDYDVSAVSMTPLNDSEQKTYAEYCGMTVESAAKERMNIKIQEQRGIIRVVSDQLEAWPMELAALKAADDELANLDINGQANLDDAIECFENTLDSIDEALYKDSTIEKEGQETQSELTDLAALTKIDQYMDEDSIKVLKNYVSAKLNEGKPVQRHPDILRLSDTVQGMRNDTMADFNAECRLKLKRFKIFERQQTQSKASEKLRRRFDVRAEHFDAARQPNGALISFYDTASEEDRVTALDRKAAAAVQASVRQKLNQDVSPDQADLMETLNKHLNKLNIKNPWIKIVVRDAFWNDIWVKNIGRITELPTKKTLDAKGNASGGKMTRERFIEKLKNTIQPDRINAVVGYAEKLDKSIEEALEKATLTADQETIRRNAIWEKFWNSDQTRILQSGVQALQTETEQTLRSRVFKEVQGQEPRSPDSHRPDDSPRPIA